VSTRDATELTGRSAAMDRPDAGPTRAQTAHHLRLQAEYCAELGSPMYAELLDRAAADAAAGGVTAAVLAGHENDREESAVALRLLAAVHRVVLAGDAPALAACYPTTGGTYEPGGTAADRAFALLRDVLADRTDEIRAGLDQPLQTNEVGRAAALLGGLLQVEAWTGLPVRLYELGCSAGLLLRADRFRYELADGFSAGPVDSPVRLDRPWEPGHWPGAGPGGTLPPMPAVVERVGCDPDPVDPTTPAGRLRLLSYVWADAPERLDRLRGALDVAAAEPATVVRADAADFLASRSPRPGSVTVVWQSFVRQYMTSAQRPLAELAVRALGAAATVDAPVVHLAFEPHLEPGGELRYLMTARIWPDPAGAGAERVLAEAHAHGLPVRWLPAGTVL
jgi:hypothetical protein